MIEIYALSQIIRNHSLYKTNADEIHSAYKILGRSGDLNTESLMDRLSFVVPSLVEEIHSQKSMISRLCDENHNLNQSGIEFVIPGHHLYPENFYFMQEPPLLLSFWGRPAWTERPSLSIVGSREPSHESLQWMERELSKYCEKNKICIVSGGARGVDQKAHSIAIRKNSPTIAVLPSGLGQIYPCSLKEWLDAVLDGGGCFLSEYGFQQKMHKHLFHHRNRLIAALSMGTLIVEARRRSGTLITAHQTIQLGHSLAVVPGHPYDSHFAGSLDLLADGAMLVRDAQDLSMLFSTDHV